MPNKARTPFERLLKEHCQKGVSANKSAGSVGRWGSTSFTSVRSASAASAAAAGSGNQAKPKPKKFFKSRAAPQEPEDEDFNTISAYGNIPTAGSKRPTPGYEVSKPDPVPAPKASMAPMRSSSKSNKFFTSRSAKEAKREAAEPPSVAEIVHMPSPQHSSPPSPKVPILKLRIKTPMPPQPATAAAVSKASSKPSGKSGSKGGKPSLILEPSTTESESGSVRSDGEDEDVDDDSDDVIVDDDDADDVENNGTNNRVPPVPAVPAPLAVAPAVIQKEKPATASGVKSYTRRNRKASAAASITAPAADVPVIPAPTSSVIPVSSAVRNSNVTAPVDLSVNPASNRRNAPVTAAPVDLSVIPATNSVRSSRRTRASPLHTPEIPDPTPMVSEVKVEETNVQQMLQKEQDESSQPAVTAVAPATYSRASRAAKRPLSPVRETIEIKEEPGIKKPAVESSSASTSASVVLPDEDDPEISFKESSPVKSPEPVWSPLKKAATVTSSFDLAKELEGQAKGQSEKVLPARPAKRSIFKSKSRDATNKKTLYWHNWKASKEDDLEEDQFKRAVMTKAVFGSTGFDFDDEPAPPTAGPSEISKLVRVASAPNKSDNSTSAKESSADPFGDPGEIVSYKCPKEQKDYYTVIKNVKKAHQIQDSGEFQEFNDDVEYILEGLGKHNNLSTRCLSTITLASKCMEPSFRMHLRAHGTVTKFFNELQDSPENASLALCAATVLFVLSQDRLNMDLDRDSLELMLNLLDTDSKIKDALDGSGMNRRELEKNKQKVMDLVAAMKAKGHAINLSLDHISADHLAMETLLSMTSKKAGEWFKEELRVLGGLDHLVLTMSDCISYLTSSEIVMWTEPLHDKLKKAGRVLKVLENVTHENEENCGYLLRYENSKFLNLIHTMFKLLDEEVPLNPSVDNAEKETVSVTLRDTLFDVMRVYINLVHDYHQKCFGSEISGAKSDMFDLTLHCMFILPASIPEEKRFDLLVLTLTLLINLVENSKKNRALLIKSRVPNDADTFVAENEREVAAQGLIRLFFEKEQSAKTEEVKTDKILDGKDEEEEDKKEEEKKKTQEERIDETVAKLLHKAGRHMEDTLIASYITIIIGYLIIDDKDVETEIREYLPEKNFEVMGAVLKKFFNFMNLTASASVTSSRGIKATEMIIKHLEKIDKKEEIKMEPKEEEESFEDLSLFEVSKDESTLDESSMSAFDSNDAFGKL